MSGSQSFPEFLIPPKLEGFFQWDKMHFPRPQTPMIEEIFLESLSEGFTQGMEEFAHPFGFRYQIIDYYAYYTIVPRDLGDEAFEDRVGRYRRYLSDVLPRMGELWSNEWLPSVIGEPPPPSDDPYGEAVIGKMFGIPPEPSRDPDVITGIAASPGLVQGRAKVVRTLAEASKIEAGDILVCEMTMPPWTPLFSTASAVVADTGGVLSHCAIVSREYRMPCVVGTVVGTSVIRDGMQLQRTGPRE